ncbi:STAS domain-containing protein [Actinophytocola sp.]|uniref:STAS domain-containing protein n=1 Tax=Actinophytocola sp. TaxID=1872138 RepID=UPI003D6A8AC0
MADPIFRRPRPAAVRRRLTSPDPTSHAPSAEVAVVSVEGDFDLANRDALAAALAPAANDPAVRLLVCDLSATTFLACAGLSVLLDAKARVEARGAALRVVAADSTVLRVLDVTGQREALDVRPVLAAALSCPGPGNAAEEGADEEGGDAAHGDGGDGDDRGGDGGDRGGDGGDCELAELGEALRRAVEGTTELAATWGRLAERVANLDADRLVDGRGGHWTPHETLAEMAEDLRVLQHHLATGALLAAPTIEDLAHLRTAAAEST